MGINFTLSMDDFTFHMSILTQVVNTWSIKPEGLSKAMTLCLPRLVFVDMVSYPDLMELRDMGHVEHDQD